MRQSVKRALVLIITIPTAAGCAKSSKDRLQGRWLGEGIDHVPSAQVAKTTGWVKGSAFEFSGSKVTVTIPAETPRSGTYKISQDEGDRLTLVFTRPEGGHDEARMRFQGEDSLRWSLPEGPEVVLVRAKD